MSTLIRPFTNDRAENRPGVELFIWRAGVLCVLLAATVVLFAFQLDRMSLARKAVTGSWCLLLLLLLLYHLHLIFLFKKLCITVAADSLTIRSFLVHEEIPFRDIRELKSLAKEKLEIRKKGLFSYFREAPQIVYPVAQIGSCTLEKFGTVRFYSFLDSLGQPKDLLLIRTGEDRRFAVSLINADELRDAIDRSRG
ncbi:MAG: hypothetical protein M0042_15075 [Nitrospiraceae bacterium]|nr:hypothetical protein [Nitrospiraceae bacterium]